MNNLKNFEQWLTEEDKLTLAEIINTINSESAKLESFIKKNKSRTILGYNPKNFVPIFINLVDVDESSIKPNDILFDFNKHMFTIVPHNDIDLEYIIENCKKLNLTQHE